MYSIYIDGIGSDTFGLYSLTETYPLLATRRTSTEYVPGRDGGITFTGDYENKELQMKFTYAPDISYQARRLMYPRVQEWLRGSKLVLGYEKDKEYDIVKVGRVDLSITQIRDDFNITFTLLPLRKSVFSNDDGIINDIDIPIDAFDYPANMTKPLFTEEGIYNVPNHGNYEAKPVISITGYGEVTLTKGSKTFTLIGMGHLEPQVDPVDPNIIHYVKIKETIHVDTAEYEVYAEDDGYIENKRQDFSGDYITLDSGDNEIQIEGNVSEVYFDFRNTFE